MGAGIEWARLVGLVCLGLACSVGGDVMSRMDILRALPQQAGDQVFTVDNTVLEVPVGNASVSVFFADAVGGGNDPWFRSGDHIILKGLWVQLPYQFGMGTLEPSISLFWEDTVGTLYDISEIGVDSNLNLPGICGRLDFPPDGLFIRQPDPGIVGGSRLRLVGALTLNVSQINAPSVLNGQTLQVGVYLQVLHTQDMEP